MLPYFSASVLSAGPAKINGWGGQGLPPLLWYANVSDITYNPDIPAAPPSRGSRVMVGFIMNNSKINVPGGSVWDYDSNLDQYGNFPNVAGFNKTTAASLYSQTQPFNSIGGWTYQPPISNNNNPLMNPLYVPETDSGVASTSVEIQGFFDTLSNYRFQWIESLYGSGDKSNKKFGDFLDVQYATGLESEIQTESKNNVPYAKKKFDPQDMLCIAIISDALNFDYIDSLNQNGTIKTAINSQIQSAIDTNNGWIFNTSFNWSKLPVIGIHGVSLPVVPIDGSAPVAGTGAGTGWMNYIDQSGSYATSLTQNNFKLMEVRAD